MNALPSTSESQDLLITLRDDTFDREVLASEQAVFVEFWADWCATCGAMAPVIRELAQSLAGHVKVATLDVGAHPGIADRYGIRGLPAMLLFHQGKVVGQATGFVPKKVLLENMEPFRKTGSV